MALGREEGREQGRAAAGQARDQQRPRPGRLRGHAEPSMGAPELEVDDADVVDAIVARLRSGEVVSIRLWGRSMFPIVLPGTRLRFVPCAAPKVRVGDVVLVARGRSLVAHRVLSISDGGSSCRETATRGPIRPSLRRTCWVARRVCHWAAPRSRSPEGIAGPLNRAAGWTGRQLTRGRSAVGRRIDGAWGVGRRVGWLRHLRRFLQPYRLELWDSSHPAQARELLLRATERPTAAALERWRRAREGADAVAWVAIDGSEVVGWAIAARVGASDTFELRLWVARSYRGLGIASALLDRVLGTAEARRWRCLRIECRPPTAAWLQTRGFEPTASPTGSAVTLERVIGPR
ncbi:MAG: GNAT family N-acetyltransferase [Sandaracinaceae bacterium]|nr:GNAT family N-acetyltransferase [Sandaracinaceae bacterium]